MKCKHEWEYFYIRDYPNGYEYEEVHIPQRKCKKCGRLQELFDGYGDYVKRWRNIYY